MIRKSMEFEQYRSAILPAALNLYFAKKNGDELPEELARVMLPQNVGDTSPTAMRLAEAQEARVNVAVRSIARIALLRDTVDERNFITGLPARLEVALSSIIDRPYLGGELGTGGLVEQVRGNGTR